eukprot:Gb_33522 [translate_table: standard]
MCFSDEDKTMTLDHIWQSTCTRPDEDIAIPTCHGDIPLVSITLGSLARIGKRTRFIPPCWSMKSYKAFIISYKPLLISRNIWYSEGVLDESFEVPKKSLDLGSCVA